MYPDWKTIRIIHEERVKQHADPKRYNDGAKLRQVLRRLYLSIIRWFPKAKRRKFSPIRKLRRTITKQNLCA